MAGEVYKRDMMFKRRKNALVHNSCKTEMTIV